MTRFLFIFFYYCIFQEVIIALANYPYVGPNLIVKLGYDSCPTSSAQLISVTIRYPGDCEPYDRASSFYVCANNIPLMGSCLYDCVTLSIYNQICLWYNSQGPSLKNVTPGSCNEEIFCLDPTTFKIDHYLSKIITSPDLDPYRDIYYNTYSIGIYNETLTKNISSGYTCWKDEITSQCRSGCVYSSVKWTLSNYRNTPQCYSEHSSFNPDFVIQQGEDFINLINQK